MKRNTTPKNTCPLCKYYDSPGFLLNAGQVIACWECNQNYEAPAEKPASVKILTESHVAAPFDSILDQFKRLIDAHRDHEATR